MDRVIVIVGPTGVGKSKLGVELAKKLNGEIISGDSVQVYRQMDIGSAKVTIDEMEGITHHLIDICDIDEVYTVKEFQYHTRRLIKDIANKNKIPIIVGGTGLYIKAALYDYEFNEQDDSEIAKLREELASYTNEQLYQKLLEVDYDSAQILHVNNRKRVLRALEIFYQSGITKSNQLANQQQKLLYNAIMIGLTTNRDNLYKIIDSRVDKMFNDGLLDEVSRFYKNEHTHNYKSMQAIGYRQLFSYFNKEITLEEAINLIKQKSRNYAKRQYTWFRNQTDTTWFEVDYNNFNNTIKDVLTYLKEME